VRSLRSADLEPILLRGPALARALYEDQASRVYVDIDLLVPPEGLSLAEAVLLRLGFSDRTVSGVIAGDRPTYAHTWVRPADSAMVDLHYTMHGIGVSAGQACEVLSERAQTEPLTVGAIDVTVLRPPGCALVVALHAAAHGARVEKPLEDLERAIDRLPLEHWRSGAILADRLRATEAFAVGLRLLPAGNELAGRLGLPRDVSVESVLRAATPPPMALGFEWLARTRGTTARVRLVARKVVPGAEFMRAWSPLARRGPVGLFCAYGLRVLWLARHAVPGLIAWSRARRQVG
jgi:hypothetical protein